MTNEVMAMPKVEYKQGVIDFENYEILINKAKELATQYSNLIITDQDSYKFASQVKAELNKVIKAISNERIRIKKEFNNPLTEFESKVKEITGEIETGKNQIDGRIREYDQRLKDEKQNKINDLIQQHAGDRYIEQNPKWLNKTFTDSKIVEEIKEQVAFAEKEEQRIETETQLIKDTCKANDIETDGFLSMYQSGSEVSDVLTAINRSVIKHKEESDKQAEEIAPEPTPSQIEFMSEEDEELINIYHRELQQTLNVKEVYNVEIKATKQEFEAIERYLKSNGIHFELTTNDDLPW
ncbi:DUF1351 domain-containing protein [Aerococcus urinaeequi]|uniref:DUF1351 domain-containing protein n=1 Tax=Aerococcus urinaeequi TaxID=51665 RepID=UPI00366BF33D